MKALLALLPISLFAAALTNLSAKPLSDEKARQAAEYIDSLVSADLKQAKLKPNGLIDDATFLRRAYLGIIGRIPSEKEARAFFDDTSPDKRAELVDELVASPGFDSHLFNWAADLLRVQTRQEQFGLGWHVWLRQSLSEDKPWDQLVVEMLDSSGHCANDPAVGYYLRDRNMQLDNFSNTMQVFLGRQIGCAQCHDHPFDEWTQYEYYQMASFGGGFNYRSKEIQEVTKRVSKEIHPPVDVRIPENANPKQKKELLRKQRRARQNQTRALAKQLQPVFKDFNRNSIFDNPDQTLRLPDDYQYKDAKPNAVVEPETLFGKRLKDIDPENRRESFAAWVAAPDNPYFTKVIANRLWARTFGHGLHDPVDDWSSDSEPAHPEVLAYLETTIKGVDYDLRQFLRVLFLTQVFQRECDVEEPVPGVPHLVRGPALQRMTAEQLYDSFLVLTKGEVSDQQLPTHANKWNAYRHQIDTLLETESRDLMILAESTKQAEQRFRQAQAEVRRIQKELGNTTDPAKRKGIQIAYQAARKKQNEANKERDPIKMGQMMMGMTGKGNKNKTARASEQSAPFNPGTLVREFGGSDRATPSSSDTVATVPQALALLNDNKTDIVGNKKTFLGRKLNSIKSPEDRLELVFLTLYSRLPTSAEIERFTPLASDPIKLRDLTRAMLTSNQFIFVQ